YIFELYEDDKRRRAGEYLHRFETKRFLYPFLRAHNGGLPIPARRSTQFLSDKDMFAVHCREFGLPAVPALLVVDNRRIEYEGENAGALPKRDLFVKMRRGTGGLGAERWEYQDPGRYRDHNGTVLEESALIEHWKRLTLAKKRGCVVLPRLVNHPDIVDLSTGALATVRAVTCRNERDEFEVTNASLRMAQGRTRLVDNFHAAGIL